MRDTHERDRKRAQRAQARAAALGADLVLTADEAALLDRFEDPIMRAGMLDHFRRSRSAAAGLGQGARLRGSRAALRRHVRRLAYLDSQRRAAQTAADAVVIALRAEGVSWDALAAELGVTRQSVIKRYRGRV